MSSLNLHVQQCKYINSQFDRTDATGTNLKLQR